MGTLTFAVECWRQSNNMPTPFVAVCEFGVYFSTLLPLALVSIQAEFSNPLDFNMQNSIHQGDLSSNPQRKLGAMQKLLFFNAKQARLKGLIDE